MCWRPLFLASLISLSLGCGGSDTQPPADQIGASAQGEAMKIRLERSGGFAGMTRTFEVDTDALPEEQRELVTGLVHNANFFALPSSLASADTGGADQFSYRISIESDGGTHTIEMSEASVPNSLTPLIDWINQNGRAGRDDRNARQ
jgi:hypothetical protein